MSSMSQRFRDFSPRAASAVIMILIAIIAFSLEPMGPYFLFLAIGTAVCYEILSVQIKKQSLTDIIGSWALALTAYKCKPVAIGLFLILLTALRIFHQPFSFSLNQRFWIVMISAALISMSLIATHIAIFYFFSEKKYVMLIVCVIAFMTDTLGYFIGKLSNQTPLDWRVSPGKTMLGYLGAFSGVFLFFAFFFSPSLYQYLLLAGCIVFSFFGDLSFSLFKRLLNIKNYSSLIPGHGGLCDRIDSVIGALFFMTITSSIFT